MFHIVLYQPEIPPNTGNIIRLCANSGTQLHLVRPLGFELDDSKLKRAGLDYREFATVRTYEDFAELRATSTIKRYFACSTKGSKSYADTLFCPGDGFVFGPESRGLPAELLATFPADNVLRIPMLPHSRSLNLSNAATVILFEAWRQHAFAGAER